MKAGDGSFLQGYNAPATVDAAQQGIVAADLTDCAADAPQLTGPIEQTIANTGLLTDSTLADPGYFSAGNVDYLFREAVRARANPA
jgi:hypothetical protein